MFVERERKRSYQNEIVVDDVDIDDDDDERRKSKKGS